MFPGGTGTNLIAATYAQDMFVIVSNNGNIYFIL
jgi:hypothetical protein